MEHKQLLTAQILLADHVDKLAVRIDEFALAQKETEGRLTILMGTMDEWIKRNPAQPL